MTAHSGHGELIIGACLCERLKSFRKARGLSMTEVAKLSGFSRPTIWSWETGKTKPRHENLLTLARALGVSEQHLIGDFDAPMLHFGLGSLISGEPARANPAISADVDSINLQALICAVQMGIAALAGVKTTNVKIMIDYSQ